MTDVRVEPYLFFGGRCEEALDFYREAIGAEVEFVLRFDEGPERPTAEDLPPGWERKVMHASFRIGETRIMASDDVNQSARFEGFALALSLASEAEAKSAFAALSEGGEVRMPLTKTFWSPCFGLVQDRFGVDWIVTLSAAKHS